MKNRNLSACCVLGSLLFVVCLALVPNDAMAGETAGMSPLKLISRAAEVMEQLKDMIARITLTDPKKGVRYEMSVAQQIYGDFDSRGIVILDQPAGLNGMTFLYHDGSGQKPAQWVYLPKTQRTRQIATLEEQTFLDVDIQFEDLQLLRLAKLDDALFRILKPSNVDGTRCAVVEKVYDEGARFKRKVLYISEKDAFPVRIEAFDAGGNLTLTSSFHDIATVQGIPTPRKIVMVDPRAKKEIIIEIPEIRYNVGLSDSFFALDDLKTASWRLAGMWRNER